MCAQSGRWCIGAAGWLYGRGISAAVVAASYIPSLLRWCAVRQYVSCCCPLHGADAQTSQTSQTRQPDQIQLLLHITKALRSLILQHHTAVWPCKGNSRIMGEPLRHTTHPPPHSRSTIKASRDYSLNGPPVNPAVSSSSPLPQPTCGVNASHPDILSSVGPSPTSMCDAVLVLSLGQSAAVTV